MEDIWQRQNGDTSFFLGGAKAHTSPSYPRARPFPVEDPRENTAFPGLRGARDQITRCYNRTLVPGWKPANRCSEIICFDGRTRQATGYELPPGTPERGGGGDERVINQADSQIERSGPAGDMDIQIARVITVTHGTIPAPRLGNLRENAGFRIEGLFQVKRDISVY